MDSSESKTTKDHFTILAANSSNGLPVAGTYSIFNVKISSSEKASITKLVDIPEAQFLNGVAKLSDDVVLISDSTAGAVYKLNVNTGAYSIVQKNTAMDPPANATLPIGINGIQILHSVLYFTNTEAKTLTRVRINSDGAAIGNYETVATGVAGDDFGFDSKGNVLVANGGENELDFVNVESGKVVVLAGSVGSTAVPGPTSVKMGRTSGDRSVAYVSFDGGLGGPINGTIIVPGGVLAVDVGKLLGKYE